MERHERFEWDPRKAAANLRKHGVPFEHGAAMLRNLHFAGYRITRFDDSADEKEDRWITFGPHPYHSGTLLAAVWTPRYDEVGSITRIVMVRRATRKERWAYEAEIYHP